MKAEPPNMYIYITYMAILRVCVKTYVFSITRLFHFHFSKPLLQVAIMHTTFTRLLQIRCAILTSMSKLLQKCETLVFFFEVRASGERPGDRGENGDLRARGAEEHK